jgi:hypothetical protein
MKRVATAAVLIPIVLVLVLRAPVPLLAAVVAAVAVLTLREYVDLVRHYNVEPFRSPLYVVTVLGFAALAAQTGGDYLIATSQMLFGIAVAVVGVAFLFLALAMQRGRGGPVKSSLTERSRRLRTPRLPPAVCGSSRSPTARRAAPPTPGARAARSSRSQESCIADCRDKSCGWRRARPGPPTRLRCRC